MVFSNKKQQSKSVQLAQQSESVLNVFSKTVKDLTEINNQIEVEQDNIDLQVNTLVLQQESLSITKDQNKKLINKIYEFLNN